MLPKMVNLNGNIYNTVGMVKLNNGAFLVAVNENVLANFDFTQIPGLSSLPQFQIKKPTSVEYVFINYIQSVLQDKLNRGEITSSDLMKIVSSVNSYVNKHAELLSNMSELDNKDNMVEAQKENLLGYFEDEMSKNEYFQKPVTNEIINDFEPIVIEQLPVEETIDFSYPVLEPVQPEQSLEPMVQLEETSNVALDAQEPVEPTMPEFNFEVSSVEPVMETAKTMPEFNFEMPAVEPALGNTTVENTIPEYNKETVDMVLNQPVDPSFDVTSFVSEYFDNFTLEQINMLLSGKFMINPQHQIMLKQRKDTMEIYNSLQASEMKKAEEVTKEQNKRKRFVRKEKSNQAAFVDTLLLSFTVGTICGVYLMYFVLTIM